MTALLRVAQFDNALDLRSFNTQDARTTLALIAKGTTCTFYHYDPSSNEPDDGVVYLKPIFLPECSAGRGRWIKCEEPSVTPPSPPSSTCCVLTTQDKNETPLATAGDESPTDILLAATPPSDGYVIVLVNGLGVSVGDGVKTKDCYFSADAGVTAKSIASLSVGDELIWNGAIAGFDLSGADRVDLNYSIGVPECCVLTDADKDQIPTATSGDESPTGILIDVTPPSDGYVIVLLNGLAVSLGDGVKTTDCYFSVDGGTTARAIADIVAGDELIWNGAVAGYELDAADVVDFNYSN